MNFEKGLLCKLTNEYANFDVNCADFVQDSVEKERKLNLELSAAGKDNVGDAKNAKKNKEHGGIIFFIGVLITILSHAVSAETGFFIITYGAIIYGARQYLKGVEQEKILQKQAELEKSINRISK